MCRVVAKDHHCVWLGVCVSAANHRTFLWLLLLLLLSSLHLCLLLSSSACPGHLLGPLLLPKVRRGHKRRRRRVTFQVCWPYTANSRLLLVGGLYRFTTELNFYSTVSLLCFNISRTQERGSLTTFSHCLSPKPADLKYFPVYRKYVHVVQWSVNLTMTLACHPQWFSGSSGAPAAGGATD